MLVITKEQFTKLKNKYFPFILMPGDEERAISFVREILDLQIAEIKRHDPDATGVITRLEAISYELYNLEQDLENELFRDTETQEPFIAED